MPAIIGPVHVAIMGDVTDIIVMLAVETGLFAQVLY